MKPDRDGYYQAPNGLHYNVRYHAGVLSLNVTPRQFEGISPQTIEWVWIREMKRYATTGEISQLCHSATGR